MLPSLSEALALSVISTGRSNVAPSAGWLSDTEGGWLTGAPPPLS